MSSGPKSGGRHLPGRDSDELRPPISGSEADAIPTIRRPGFIIEGFAALKPMIEALALVAALTFVAGWSFLSSYLSAFGLNPLELDIPSSLASIFALHVLYRSVWPIVLIISVAATLATIRTIVAPKRVPLGSVATALLLVAIVSFAVAGIKLGRTNAHNDLFEFSSRLPTVGFNTDLKGDYPACVSEGLTECRLLVHWKQTYYFFEPLKGAVSALPTPSIQLYALPDNQVRFVRFIRGVDE